MSKGCKEGNDLVRPPLVQDTPLSFETLKMAAPRPAPVPRTRSRSRITAPQLEQFVVVDVQLTRVSLGAGTWCLWQCGGGGDTWS